MSALSAAKLGLDRAAPKVNRLLMAVTDALVLFIDALLKVEQQAKPGMRIRPAYCRSYCARAGAARYQRSRRPCSRQVLHTGGRGGVPAAGRRGTARPTDRDSPQRVPCVCLQRVMCLLAEGHVFACRGSCVCLYNAGPTLIGC